MRNLDNLSYKDISEILKIPLGTVEIRLHRANKILEKEYKKIFKVK